MYILYAIVALMMVYVACFKDNFEAENLKKVVTNVGIVTFIVVIFAILLNVISR